MGKVLVFEGAGWQGADSSIESGVGNCRIRTRIRNKQGRLIYLEMGGFKHTGKIIPKWSEGLNFTGRVDHCFYDDASWDKRRNYSRDLSQIEDENFEYNRENILKLVNEKLDCDFEHIEVVNEGLRVHSTENPLCDCSQEGYKPFEEITVNIGELEGIKPYREYKHYNQLDYIIDCNEIKHLIPNIIKRYDEHEVKKRLQKPCKIIFRYNSNNIITSCDLSCGFGYIGMSAEDLGEIITIIKNNN